MSNLHQSESTSNHDRQTLGRSGEDLAAQWYEASGATIVDRNWRHGRNGEIDLIVQHGDTVIFCEVKTRRSTRWGIPAEAVGWEKQRRIRSLAAAWLGARQERSGHARFDVASVVINQSEVTIDVIEAAF